MYANRESRSRSHKKSRSNDEIVMFLVKNMREIEMIIINILILKSSRKNHKLFYFIYFFFVLNKNEHAWLVSLVVQHGNACIFWWGIYYKKKK